MHVTRTRNGERGMGNGERETSTESGKMKTGNKTENLKLSLTAAGLAQSVERLTAEREVAGSIPWTGPILKVLK